MDVTVACQGFWLCVGAVLVGGQGACMGEVLLVGRRDDGRPSCVFLASPLPHPALEGWHAFAHATKALPRRPLAPHKHQGPPHDSFLPSHQPTFFTQAFLSSLPSPSPLPYQL